MLKEREDRVKRVRHEQEAERLKKADEWKQQVSTQIFITSRYFHQKIKKRNDKYQ